MSLQDQAYSNHPKQAFSTNPAQNTSIQVNPADLKKNTATTSHKLVLYQIHYEDHHTDNKRRLIKISEGETNKKKRKKLKKTKSMITSHSRSCRPPRPAGPPSQENQTSELLPPLKHQRAATSSHERATHRAGSAPGTFQKLRSDPSPSPPDTHTQLPPSSNQCRSPLPSPPQPLPPRPLLPRRRRDPLRRDRGEGGGRCACASSSPLRELSSPPPPPHAAL